MRMYPAQLAVHLMCGSEFPRERGALRERMQNGHSMLVSIAKVDFGYDLQAWHDHLKETRDGGYTWNRTIKLPKVMKKALESDEWVAEAEFLEMRLERHA